MGWKPLEEESGVKELATDLPSHAVSTLEASSGRFPPAPGRSPTIRSETESVPFRVTDAPFYRTDKTSTSVRVGGSGGVGERICSPASPRALTPE